MSSDGYPMIIDTLKNQVCGHELCSNCLKTLIKHTNEKYKKCPICRKPIIKAIPNITLGSILNKEWHVPKRRKKSKVSQTIATLPHIERFIRFDECDMSGYLGKQGQRFWAMA